VLELTQRVGREAAQERLAAALSSGRPLHETLGDDLGELLDPAGYLGSARLFADRSLALYEEEDS
jgi:hypothetical protein